LEIGERSDRPAILPVGIDIEIRRCGTRAKSVQERCETGIHLRGQTSASTACGSAADAAPAWELAAHIIRHREPRPWSPPRMFTPSQREDDGDHILEIDVV